MVENLLIGSDVLSGESKREDLPSSVAGIGQNQKSWKGKLGGET
jgi:hypothetical protein